MKKKIAFIIYLFYRYYDDSKSSKRIAYESAVLAVTFFLGLNLLAINAYFEIIPPLSTNNSRGVIFLKYGLLYLVPAYLIINLLFKKDYIRNLKFSENTISKANIWLIIYLLSSIIILIIIISLR